jgi:arylsulfatase A-like enzyme
VPLLIRWPAGVAPGVSKALVTQVDLLASFARLMGQTVPADAARAHVYKLNQDVGEAENQADRHPRMVEEMQSLLAEYRSQGLAR